MYFLHDPMTQSYLSAIDFARWQKRTVYRIMKNEVPLTKEVSLCSTNVTASHDENLST